MTENREKEIKEAKISTDTLFVLLLVICGIAAVILVGYLLYKPEEISKDVVIRDIVLDGTVLEENDSVESVEKSLENSYLAESDDNETEPEPEPVAKDEPVTDKVNTTDKPIFKPTTNNTTIKQTATKTTIVKKKTPEQKLVTVKAYWIQVGSFSTSAQASKSVELLKEKGLSSRVVLKTVNGKTVYRVRIGAYESRDEANKFLEEVKKIDGFGESYVSEATTQKYVDI